MNKIICRHFIKTTILKLDIGRVISHYVPHSKTTGNSLMLRCPFHNDKNPSMGVRKDKGFYHCFSCGASGNVIKFVEEHCGVDTNAAVEAIARICNLKVIYTHASPEVMKREQILQTLSSVQVLFTKGASVRAITYLRKRGILTKAQRLYDLGFASGEIKADVDVEQVKAYSDAGVFRTTASGQFFSIFEGRITFPIRSPGGRIIGFGGRVIGESHPKYINSPQTAVFTKSRCVYGLYEAINIIRAMAKEERFAVLVEGYFDVVSLGQEGVPAVACLGTSVSEFQLQLIFQYVDRIFVCLDGDKGGRESTKNILTSFASLNIKKDLLFCELPEGQDPDSIVNEKGKSYFYGLLQKSLSFEDYFVRITSDTNTLKSLLNADQIISKIPSGNLQLSITHAFAKAHDLPVHEVCSNLLTSSKPMAIARDTAASIYSIKAVKDPMLLSSLKGDGQASRANAPLLREEVAMSILLQNPHFANHIPTGARYSPKFNDFLQNLQSPEMPKLEKFLTYDWSYLNEEDLKDKLIHQLTSMELIKLTWDESCKKLFPTVVKIEAQLLILGAIASKQLHLIPLILKE